MPVCMPLLIIYYQVIMSILINAPFFDSSFGRDVFRPVLISAQFQEKVDAFL